MSGHHEPDPHKRLWPESVPGTRRCQSPGDKRPVPDPEALGCDTQGSPTGEASSRRSGPRVQTPGRQSRTRWWLAFRYSNVPGPQGLCPRCPQRTNQWRPSPALQDKLAPLPGGQASARLLLLSIPKSCPPPRVTR